MADWQTRLAPEIEFISPLGTQFFGKWKRTPRTVDKKLGIHAFPGVNGEVVQDLALNSNRYSLQFFFDGPDHDLIAIQFMEALKEKGLWQVVHPVEGFIGLQPVSITKTDDVIESGNITEFTGEWIEPIDERTLKTARELVGLVDALSNETNGTSAEQFDDEVMDFT
jgi:prophage DNA circulation protein